MAKISKQRSRKAHQQGLTNEQIRARIAEVLWRKKSLGPDAIDDAAFHLTDWLSEHRQLVRLFETTEPWDAESAYDILLRFVIHAPAHMAAASRIILGFPVEDTFDIGAVKGSGRPPSRVKKPAPRKEPAPAPAKRASKAVRGSKRRPPIQQPDRPRGR